MSDIENAVDALRDLVRDHERVEDFTHWAFDHAQGVAARVAAVEDVAVEELAGKWIEVGSLLADRIGKSELVVDPLEALALAALAQKRKGSARKIISRLRGIQGDSRDGNVRSEIEKGCIPEKWSLCAHLNMFFFLEL